MLLPSLAVDDGMTYLAGGNVQSAQLLFELVGVVDHCGKVSEGDELAVVEEAAYEASIAVAALLAVGDHIDTGAKLGVDGESGGVVSGGLEVLFVEATFEPVVDSLEHPAGPGPTPDAHDGQRCDPRGRGRVGGGSRGW